MDSWLDSSDSSEEVVSLVKPFSSQLSAMPSPSQLQSPWGSEVRSSERLDSPESSRASLLSEDPLDSEDSLDSELELPEDSLELSELSSEEESSEDSVPPEVSASPERAVPQVGQAPAPWPARTFSAIAICSLWEARSARSAYWVPP